MWLGLGALAIEYLRVKLGLGALAIDILRLGLGLGLGALAIDILELGLGCIGYRYLRVRVREQKMYNEDDNHSELNTQEDTNIPDDKVIETIEDCYDFCQTYLKALLATISRDSIREIWRIIPYMSSNSYQHVILLKDGTFLCTCLLLVSRGIVCQHYFKLMVEDLSVLFHVMLMSSRWFKIDF
ncbi:unnamed protein product [Rhizophagus irregularis]|uniref:SWIM-type domain-containing protein n=1 Tax=Rhizophagus irregularis TaxID=588596 RepID=A0A915Z7K6_9GLOM|nr:unnamed protein product [Rhizophagus irregularis]